MSRHPEVKWAQREDKVYLTVVLPDAKNPIANVEKNGRFTFKATVGPQVYELDLQLLDRINVDESNFNTSQRSVICVLVKEEKKWWKKLIKGDEKLLFLKVDWDKWADEDEDGNGNLDMSGMDFSKFGGAEGLDDLDDSDEYGEEAERPGPVGGAMEEVEEEADGKGASGNTSKVEAVKSEL